MSPSSQGSSIDSASSRRRRRACGRAGPYSARACHMAAPAPSRRRRLEIKPPRPHGHVRGALRVLRRRLAAPLARYAPLAERERRRSARASSRRTRSSLSRISGVSRARDRGTASPPPRAEVASWIRAIAGRSRGSGADARRSPSGPGEHARPKVRGLSEGAPRRGRPGSRSGATMPTCSEAATRSSGPDAIAPGLLGHRRRRPSRSRTADGRPRDGLHERVERLVRRHRPSASPSRIVVAPW